MGGYPLREKGLWEGRKRRVSAAWCAAPSVPRALGLSPSMLVRLASAPRAPAPADPSRPSPPPGFVVALVPSR
eukprot:scaffold3667_cov110-Isochrysis_galbana.AAC.12